MDSVKAAKQPRLRGRYARASGDVGISSTETGTVEAFFTENPTNAYASNSAATVCIIVGSYLETGCDICVLHTPFGMRV